MQYFLFYYNFVRVHTEYLLMKPQSNAAKKWRDFSYKINHVPCVVGTLLIHVYKHCLSEKHVRCRAACRFTAPMLHMLLETRITRSLLQQYQAINILKFHWTISCYTQYSRLVADLKSSALLDASFNFSTFRLFVLRKNGFTLCSKFYFRKFVWITKICYNESQKVVTGRTKEICCYINLFVPF